MARVISEILFNLGSYNFLTYLECVRSYAWSKGHSDPDLSSVTDENTVTLQDYLPKISQQSYHSTLYTTFGLTKDILG